MEVGFYGLGSKILLLQVPLAYEQATPTKLNLPRYVTQISKPKRTEDAKKKKVTLVNGNLSANKTRTGLREQRMENLEETNSRKSVLPRNHYILKRNHMHPLDKALLWTEEAAQQSGCSGSQKC